MTKIINTITGALSVVSCKERPSSFSDTCRSAEKTLYIYPSLRADFEACLVSREGAVLTAPYESAFVTSRHFSGRGLPYSSVTLLCCDELFEVPIYSGNREYEMKYPAKCKGLFAKCVHISGGMPQNVYTECGKNRSRLIKAPSEADISAEHLKRLCVIEGLPDTVRAIAYRESEGVYRMAVSDSVLTLDGVLPLASLLHRQGVRGDVTAVCRSVEFKMTLGSPGDENIYIDGSDFFTEGS